MVNKLRLGEAVIMQVWDLASLDDGWLSAHKAAKLEPELIEVVGYVIGIKRHSVVLAMGWSEGADHALGDVMVAFAIPVGCIKSCHGLKAGPRRSIEGLNETTERTRKEVGGSERGSSSRHSNTRRNAGVEDVAESSKPLLRRKAPLQRRSTKAATRVERTSKGRAHLGRVDA